MNKNQLQSEQTRKLLVEKLTQLIRNGKVDDFTIRGLCSELGFSPRTFYLYFESKEHAINECYFFPEELLVEHADKINANEKNPLKRLYNIFLTGFKYSKIEYVTLKTIHICMIKVYNEYVNSKQTDFFRLVHEALNDCVEAGYQFSSDNDDITWELISFYRGIIYNYLLSNQGFDLEKVGMARLERYFRSFIKT